MTRITLPAIAAAIVAMGILSACGGGSSSVSPNASPKAKVQALEESGAIPNLERTDTVAGIDADTNGIRDDVEAYISAQYGTADQKAAARQFAAVMQAALLVDTTDLAAVKAISVRGSRAVNCIYRQFDAGGDKQPAAVVAEIRSASTNTKPRLMAYLAYSKALDGTSSALPEGNTCE